MSETEIYQVKRLAESAPAQVYPYIKRLIDLAICALALIWLLPIMGLIALAIVLDSPGSFLFVQTRIGKDGRPFRIYKFRTMSSNYDSSEDRKYMAAFVAGIAGPNKDGEGKTTFKPAMDSHITRVGRFLRKSSLDELPQIWNVLRGDMSLIGPRPNVPWEVEQYTEIQPNALPYCLGSPAWHRCAVAAMSLSRKSSSMTSITCAGRASCSICRSCGGLWPRF